MIPLKSARAHLVKANEFLEIAQVSHDLGLYNAAASNAVTFARLLRLKPKSQYQDSMVSAVDATKAVEWAQRMYDAAAALVTS